MTSLIDRLVKDGNVKRSRSKEDRRIVKIEITEEGKDFLIEGRKAVEKNIKENILNLTETEIEVLNDSLENIKKLLLKMDNK
jgi:DNA-binding MarR family transcriptional regulator